jgi:energy-coupling factor transporter transmembrane protein EcfT
MILSLSLLWKEKQQKPTYFILLSLIFLFSVLVHFSHLLIASILIAIVTSVHFLRPQLVTIKRWLLLPLLILSGWFILPTMNYMIDDEFKISKGSHVFFISHLNDTGLLKTILDNYCPTDEFSGVKLCDYKDSLPHDAASFIWSTDILEKTGGWEGSKEEYDKIIRLSFTQPRYLLNNISKSFLYGMIQLTKNKIGEGLSPYTEHSAPYGQIHWRFNHEVNNYMMSRQNKYNGYELDLKLLNQVQLFILILSFLACIYLFTHRRWLKLSKNGQFLLLFIITGIIINSMVTAGLNTPYDRYQARVVWLLPFVLLLLLVHHRTDLKRWAFGKLNQLRN